MAYYKIHVGNRTTVIRSEASLEEMGVSYKDDLIGECDKFGNLQVPYISPEATLVIAEAARLFDLEYEFKDNLLIRKATGAVVADYTPLQTNQEQLNNLLDHQFVRSCTVESPLFQQIFNDLITPPIEANKRIVNLTPPLTSQVDGWQDQYLQEVKLFGLDKANDRFIERQKEQIERDHYGLTPRRVDELQRLLEPQTVTTPEQCGITDVGATNPMSEYSMQHPSQEDYRAACRGERPWPVMVTREMYDRAGLGEPVEIKGVVLRQGKAIDLKDIVKQLLDDPQGLPEDVRERLELMTGQVIKLISEDPVPLTDRRYYRTANYLHLDDCIRGYFTRHLNTFLDKNEQRENPMRKASLEAIVRDATRAAHAYVAKVLEPQFLIQGFARSFIFDNVERDVMVISQSDYSGVRPIIKVTHGAGNFHLDHLLD